MARIHSDLCHLNRGRRDPKVFPSVYNRWSPACATACLVGRRSSDPCQSRPVDRSVCAAGVNQYRGFIAAYDLATGNLDGLLHDANGKPLVLNGIWSLSSAKV